MRSFRTPVVAAAAVALLASCGVAPQTRPAPTAGASAQQDLATRQAARYRTLTAPVVCSCNAAYLSAIDTVSDPRQPIVTNFLVVDNGASDTSVVQIFHGTTAYEGTNESVVISGATVTITGTLQNINGANPDINVVITLDVTNGAYTTTVNGNLVASGTAAPGNFGLVSNSCDLPIFQFPFPQVN